MEYRIRFDCKIRSMSILSTACPVTAFYRCEPVALVTHNISSRFLDVLISSYTIYFFLIRILLLSVEQTSCSINRLGNNKSVSNAILKGPDMCKQQGNQ